MLALYVRNTFALSPSMIDLKYSLRSLERREAREVSGVGLRACVVRRAVSETRPGAHLGLDVVEDLVRPLLVREELLDQRERLGDHRRRVVVHDRVLMMGEGL